MLTLTERVVKGRQRKYCAATPKGEATLDAARTKLDELAAEVLHGEGPGPLADPSDDASIDPPSL